jgi:Cys-tRNA(Pro)/Cys-tRNA(Cys) deacylase
MTPACRALDAVGVAYSLHPYAHDAAASSYGNEAALALGVERDRVFKTLMAVLETDELVVGIVPVSGMLDLRKLASTFDTKRATMAPLRDAERSSGYVAGGISPFGQRTQRRTAIDELAFAADTVFVSGGRRGLELELAPADLVAVLDAQVAALS